MVGLVVVGLKHSRVLGCFFEWELWRYAMLNLDMLVALVEPSVSPIFSSSSTTMGGSAKVCWRKSWMLVKCIGGHTLTVTNPTVLT